MNKLTGAPYQYIFYPHMGCACGVVQIDAMDKVFVETRPPESYNIDVVTSLSDRHP
jgi:hypothetical protein